MILWAALLMSYCCLGLNGAAATLERIEQCNTKCSQGLHCKTKPDYLFPQCQTPADGLNASLFHDVSLSTVMRCEGRQKCSLHLRIKTTLRLTEAIQGVSVCTETEGVMSTCRILSFTRASRERMSGQQVEVQNDCTVVSAGERVKVTLKTVPTFCGITWTGTYEAPDCVSDDLKRHVPECITGRLSYEVNPQRKELSVSVTDMLEDYDYRLRLCHKNFMCTGTGATALIKKEEAVKSATLPYTRPLPCLCLEGWSTMMDAPRIQVCPFKERIEELWSGIMFDLVERALSWSPSCPVTAVAQLCQKGEGDVCADLPNASKNVTKEKITFTNVDPHPKLCMKFTVGSQSWIRCPFASASVQAWDVTVTAERGRTEVKMVSQIEATLSIELCAKSNGSDVCQSTQTQTVHVEKHKPVDLNLQGELCGSCLQVKRADVKFSVTVVHCLEPCYSPQRALQSLDLTWVVLPVGVCLSAVIIVTLILHVLLTVYRRRKQNRKGGCMSERKTDHDFNCVVPIATSKPVLHGGVFIPDSPQCGNTEKANLISD